MTETRRTGFAEVNGTRLYYEVAGTGHPLTLIHGGLVNRRLWDDQFDAFAQRYRVIRFDIRGFGDSAPPTPETPPYFLEEDIHSLLKFLDVEKTYVMGLSMGGALAINFTLMYPEMVDALIPVAMGLGGFEATEEDKQLEGWNQVEEAAKSGNIAQAVEVTLRAWTDGPGRTPDQVSPAVREKVRAMTTHNFELPEYDNATQPQELETPAISRLAEIHVPTLILVGDQDVPSILKISDILEKGISGARKVVIPDTAHHLPMEKPQEFNQIVLDFLGSLQH
ncbi:MAG TPA: alpha/beta hydrolase [Ktedonobacteraceae bacterium]|nr:alpha/beta hydrolase [Ktedonobacteraceae bacterium]